MIACAHSDAKKFGHDRHGNPRFRCKLCGKTWTVKQPKQLGAMRLTIDKAKIVLRLLVEGNSIRSTERLTGVHRDTVCKLIVRFGDACARFMDEQMHGLTLSHLQFDELFETVLCPALQV